MSDQARKPSASLEDTWRRWQMDELAPPRSPVRSDPASREKSQASSLASQINLTQVREQARRAAHEEGYQQGLAEGRETGFAAGHAEGLEQGLTEGRAEGLQQGRAQAEEELQQQLQSVLKPLQPIAQHFDEALQQLSEEISAHLVELAYATGHHLAREQLDAQPQRIADIVRDLLHSDPMLSGKPRVWLHPEDEALVREQLGSELDAAGWTLQPDPQISRGGCRASSTSGEIDATWEARWDSLISRVRRRDQHRQPGKPEAEQ